MEGLISRDDLIALDNGQTRYEWIAGALEQAIASGRLPPGERLPTIRRLAADLGVSETTAAAAYTLLQTRGRICSKVGRGTFVADLSSPEPGDLPTTGTTSSVWPANSRSKALLAAPWRKRALMASAAQLRSAHPRAADCSTGRPDPALLPLVPVQRAWQSAIASLVPGDLQYAAPAPILPLVRELLPRLAAEGVAAGKDDLVVGSSAQQLMVLALEVMAAVSGNLTTAVAVEEPGYPTIFDTVERAGHRLVGVEVDADGAVPESLDTALASGPAVVLLTPRAHNPTGASWTAARRDALADVLAAHPKVFAIEDDQFAGITTTRPGSLLADRRIENRVVYVRSFSKAIAPDLRIAVAVARPRLRSLLLEAKSFADGWTSCLVQRVLADLLADQELHDTLVAARAAYASRRDAAARVLTSGLAPSGGGAASGDDGVNVWVQLPPGVESLEVIERAAALGVLTAPGEPFFIRPGRSDVVRLNAGAVGTDRVTEAAQALVVAATTAVGVAPTAVAV